MNSTIVAIVACGMHDSLQSALEAQTEVLPRGLVIVPTIEEAKAIIAKEIPRTDTFIITDRMTSDLTCEMPYVKIVNKPNYKPYRSKMTRGRK